MAELTLAELQKLVQDTIVQSKAVSDAGTRTAARVDELQSSVQELTTSTTAAIDRLDKSSNASLNKVDATLNRVISAHNTLEQTAESVKQSVEAVARRVDRLEHSQPPSATPQQPYQLAGTLRPHGHGIVTGLQGAVTRENRTPGHTLVRGEHSHLQDTHIDDYSDDNDDIMGARHHANHFDHARPLSRLPRSDFPQFDRENPRWWKKQCEKYFKMYNVMPHLWVDFATMHFQGNAQFWLQTYEAMHSIDGWPDLCVAVFAKFNKNQYAKLMDTFFAFKEVDSVDAYAHEFEQLMHKIDHPKS